MEVGDWGRRLVCSQALASFPSCCIIIIRLLSLQFYCHLLFPFALVASYYCCCHFSFLYYLQHDLFTTVFPFETCFYCFT